MLLFGKDNAHGKLREATAFHLKLEHSLDQIRLSLFLCLSLFVIVCYCLLLFVIVCSFFIVCYCLLLFVIVCYCLFCYSLLLFVIVCYCLLFFVFVCYCLSSFFVNVSYFLNCLLLFVIICYCLLLFVYCSNKITIVRPLPPKQLLSTWNSTWVLLHFVIKGCCCCNQDLVQITSSHDDTMLTLLLPTNIQIFASLT